jgi:hypothetical protein
MSCANSMTGVREIRNRMKMVRMNYPFCAAKGHPSAGRGKIQWEKNTLCV